MKKNLLAGLVASLFVSGASAFEPFTVKDIRVDGIQRTEAGTVFSYLPIKVGDTLTDDKAAQAIKALFATGFFKDVRIEIESDVVVVAVEERPAIAQIDFTGLKEFDKDQMIKGLKEAGFAVSRSFDRSMLEKAEQELKRQYLTRGKYSVSITTTVTPLERNRVGINFKIDEGDAATIKQINIVGANSFREKELLEVFQLQTPNWISWYTKNDQYSKQKLSADLEALRSFYLNRGFLEFNIESTQVSISPDKKDIYITATVSEGERYIVSSIKLAGELTLPEEELRAAMKIKPGDVFSRENLNESTKAISDKLSSRGYAFANVNAAPEIDKEKRRVAFTVFIDPGKRVYVRRINVTGNTKTRDEVVRQEVRQMEGAWYDDERVKLSRQRIDKTDYFSEVNVETLPVVGTTDQVDVNFNVTEKSTGNISLGVGYSDSENVILSGSISQANIFGSGKFASLQLSTGSVNRTLGISYTNPYFTVDGVSQGFDIYERKTDPTSLGYVYKTHSTGGGIRFGFPISEKQTLNFGAAIDYTKVEIDRTDTDTPLQYVDFIDEFCGTDTYKCGNTSVPLTASWVSNTKDSAINPTRGVYQKASFEVSPLGDLNYYRATYQHQRFYPVTRTMVLMLNGEVGYANGLGGQELPFFKNLYAGGVGSVRGYDTASLGPYEIDSDGDEVRLGGTKRFVFNAELTMPLPGFGADKSMRFGPFFDAGQVYSDAADKNSDVYDSGPVRMSVGLAATWLSPFGPLKFSFAQPLNEQKNDNIQKFQFQMGTTF
ncbi:outer membrane protein assembly factor BamA [Propionivibrio limicola]|uniref:outer membrane protein assembly factor BamA n=1 Tax=Propionivibrio limicola TaxID=167645 RepID=UPI001291B69C|nr:outer membrane protein assembly factor BamA [Propionivibrio limicola]